MGDGPGEREPAHLAAGEVVRVDVGEGVQTERPQQGVDALLRGVVVQPEDPTGAQDVLAHRARDDRELGLLRHPAHPPGELG